ncbi:Cardiolipin synthase [Acaryochloris thomasi RCC1774]|uniref:phospholipase D n=1 Tax=Acaryochloris thomasi RCC1774 TaxID=1764569 RepID=A0A2W1JYA4_9CYAN|nr:phospholipase D-like domain-containing protein [Acaryochloris thomasi]PZD74504.1 Cardiolipin synthase [Acaryochloris thomasi RCC1774]
MKPWVRSLLLWSCCLTALGFLLVRQRQTVQVQALPTLPQHSRVQVYMNQNPTASYQDPYRQILRSGDDLEQIIVDQILAARSSVEVAVQELRSQKIAKALRNRHQAGVQVRLILENIYSRPWSSFTPSEVAQFTERQRDRYQDGLALIDRDRDNQISPSESAQFDALQIIQNAGILWLDDTADGSAGSGLMHHKFVVIDQQIVVSTTANFTLSGLHGDLQNPTSRGNANSLLVLESPELATAFRDEFDVMWGDGPSGQVDSIFGVRKPFRPVQRFTLDDATIQVKFSPTSSRLPWQSSTNGLIGSTLQQSKDTVDLALFVFSEQNLVNQLATEHQQGTVVRALVDSSFAYQSYSEVLDMLGVFRSRLPNTCAIEVNNQPWQRPIETVGVPRLPKGDRLHHKYGVIDQRTVIVGSHNWSDAANEINDETLLVIEHPTVAAHFHREFERLYASSRLGIPSFLQQEFERCSGVESGRSVTQQAEPVNLNTATQAELENLPGIGPKLAANIITARQIQPFNSLEEIDRVPGVGPKLLQTLQGQITW